MALLWVARLVQCYPIFFFGYHEALLFDSTAKPCMYQRYVDDTFAIFKMENDSEMFLQQTQFLASFMKIHHGKRGGRVAIIS